MKKQNASLSNESRKTPITPRQQLQRYRRTSLKSIENDNWDDDVGKNTRRETAEELKGESAILLNGRSDETDNAKSATGVDTNQTKREEEDTDRVSPKQEKRDCKATAHRRKKNEEEMLEHFKKRNTKKSKKKKKEKEVLQKYLKEIETQRDTFIDQWKTAFFEEQEAQKQAEEDSRWLNRAKKFLASKSSPWWNLFINFLRDAELFICNLPLTIGPIGTAWATMGAVWFKFMEENSDSCTPVHFHSTRCTFPEFPGCFECDTDEFYYKLALNWHYVCDCVSGLLVLGFLAKLLLAPRLVYDELSNPTTSRPAGSVCMAINVVAAGHGEIGKSVVLVTSFIHLGLALWFLYLALFKYHILPDPGWFPSLTGLAYAAVKGYLYYPKLGYFFMIVTLIFFFGTYFISMIRVFLNKKISAQTCWIQMAGPSATLYSFTIVAQASLREEQIFEILPEAKLRFQTILQDFYLPFQHMMFVFTLMAVLSAFHAVYSRWDKLKSQPFNPAHAAFCNPTLSHANCIQSYRGAINSFSTIAMGSPFKIVLFSYWVLFLVGGTINNIIITFKYLRKLPEWTKVDISAEVEPPSPLETIMSQVLDVGDTMTQNLVSPAVLQANETGTLVRVRRGTDDWRKGHTYVRTRHVTALGFDPVMTWSEFSQEREALLEWVANNAPRARTRTLSGPGSSTLTPYGTCDEKRNHRRWNTEG